MRLQEDLYLLSGNHLVAVLIDGIEEALRPEFFVTEQGRGLAVQFHEAVAESVDELSEKPVGVSKTSITGRARRTAARRERHMIKIAVVEVGTAIKVAKPVRVWHKGRSHVFVFDSFILFMIMIPQDKLRMRI